MLHNAGIYVAFKNFENLDGIIINDEDNCTIVELIQIVVCKDKDLQPRMNIVVL